MAQSNASTRWRWWIGAALGCAIGLLVDWKEPFAASRADFPFQIIAAGFLSIALHEAGHAIAAVLAGFRLLIFAVWPLQLRRRATGWSLGRMEKLRVGGFVLAVPHGSDDLRRKWFKIILAGPFASLISGGLAALLYWRFSTEWPGLIAAQLECLAFWNLLFGFTGLFPIRSKYAVTDGARMRILLHDGAEAERFLNLTLLLGASFNGVRPNEWPRELVETLSSQRDRTRDALACQMMRYNWLIDAGRWEEASEILTWLFSDDVPEDIKPIWQLERAWFEARFAGNLPAAKEWLEAGSRRDKRPGYLCGLYKAQAAIALLEHRWADVESAAREALKNCDKLADPGIAIAIRDRVEAVLADSRKNRATSAAGVRHREDSNLSHSRDPWRRDRCDSSPSSR